MTLTLQNLIYGYNNTIVVESKTIAGIFKEIEMVRNNFSLEGWIFRPTFAKNVKFIEYSDSDYMAIYAQWSLSFGWSSLFEFMSGKNPQNLLDSYLSEAINKDLSPLITEDKKPIVKEKDYLYFLTKTFLESKTILTSQQKTILENMEIEILFKVFKEIKHIPILENKYIVIKQLLLSNISFNPFSHIKDIIPVLVYTYGKINNESFNFDTKINKTILKEVKVRIPTSLKRKVLNYLISELNNLEDKNPNSAKDAIKKYQTFWKNLLRQLLIKNSYKKTFSQYPEIKNIYRVIYSNINTNKTVVEEFRKKGDLANAFKMDMLNSGALFRNILFYLRNDIGTLYPVKFKTIAKNPNHIQTPVISDVSNILYSKKFKKFLLTVNPKLLLQVETLLKDKKYQKVQTFKVVNKKRIIYSKGIPPLNKKLTKQMLKLIQKSYSKIKKIENKKLGKVFISDSLSNLKLTFSGRLDVSTNKSGTFLPIGSKLKIDNMNKENFLLRYGVSWKSPENQKKLSICIDPSIHILNGEFANKIINWEGNNNTLKNADKILISSSGDITSCTFDRWSTELVDIDIQALKKAGSTKLFTAIINYDANGNRGGSLGNVNTHVFFNIIEKDNRIIDGRNVSISLDEMDYSFEIIDDNAQAQIGLLFDFEENTVEVLKISIEDLSSSQTATLLNSSFLELINNRPKLPLLVKTIKKSISKKQIVDNPKIADLVLDDNVDINIIQNIIY